MIKQVIEFHEAFGVPLAATPMFPGSDRCNFRINFLHEELEEFTEAVLKQDMVEAADAICDMLYVILGTAAEFGLGNKLEALFNEVHRSNMSKLDDKGRPIVRGDGKIMKSLNFSPPNLKKILE